MNKCGRECNTTEAQEAEKAGLPAARWYCAAIGGAAALSASVSVTEQKRDSGVGRANYICGPGAGLPLVARPPLCRSGINAKPVKLGLRSLSANCGLS